jgi:hypothetical protein
MRLFNISTAGKHYFKNSAEVKEKYIFDKSGDPCVDPNKITTQQNPQHIQGIETHKVNNRFMKISESVNSSSEGCNK